MRYAPGHKAETRATILDVATQLLCRYGPDAITIHRVMREAGLSHGGFYAHFASRDALVAAALESAAARTRERLFDDPADQATSLRDVAARYLGRAHLAPENGCPLPAASGVALTDPNVAAIRERAVDSYLKDLTRLVGDGTKADAILALLVGGLAVARTFEGERAEAVLRACRQAARKLAEG